MSHDRELTLIESLCFGVPPTLELRSLSDASDAFLEFDDEADDDAVEPDDVGDAET